MGIQVRKVPDTASELETWRPSRSVSRRQTQTRSPRLPRRCHDIGCNITKSTISYGYDILSYWYHRTNHTRNHTRNHKLLISYAKTYEMYMISAMKIAQERLFIIVFVISYMISQHKIWYHTQYHSFWYDIIRARKAKITIIYDIMRNIIVFVCDIIHEIIYDSEISYMIS